MEQDNLVITNEDNVSIVSFNIPCISSASGIDQMSEQLRRYVTEKQPAKIVVDFDGVKFFSSQMLGLLVDLWRRVKEYGGTLLISGINSQLSRVFKITNLDRIFKFCPDKDQALKTLGESQ